MKGLRVGYVFVMVTLFTLVVAVGVAAFYPAPKRYEYPTYPTSAGLDYNSSEHQAQQSKYQKDLDEYDKKNKDIENQRKVWGQHTFIISLIFGVVFLFLGMAGTTVAPMLGVSLLFSAFILMIFGPGFISYYADSTTIPLFREPSISLTGYKVAQFFILLVGMAIGTLLGLAKLGGRRPEGM